MSRGKPQAHLGHYWPIVVDVETGGVDHNTDALLEIAAIPLKYDFEQGWILGEVYHWHVIPFEGGRLVPEAMAIHGIEPDHPFRLAVSEQEMCEDFAAKMKTIVEENNCSRGILVGHNAHFDLNFLMSAARRSDRSLPIHSFTCFDTATFGAYWSGETVLAKLLAIHGIEFQAEQAHSAIYDAKVTAQLVCFWLNQRQDPRFFSAGSPRS